jgi:hypothetical protein
MVAFTHIHPHRLGHVAALWPIDLDLHHLALYDLGLLLDAHADGLAEGLGAAGVGAGVFA